MGAASRGPTLEAIVLLVTVTADLFHKGYCGCSAYCDAGCQSREGSCTKCNLGYGLDASEPRICQPCDPNCRPDVGCNLAGARKCDGFCNPGYTIDGITKRCNPTGGSIPGTTRPVLVCDPNCRSDIGCSLSGSQKCDGICNAGYLFDGASKRCNFVGGSLSSSTRPNQPQTTPRSATGCSAHCSAGCGRTGSGSCDQCDIGYGLNNAAKKVCQPCDPHCTNGCLYSGAGGCDGNCASGYTYDSTTKICAPPQGQQDCDKNCDNGCNAAGTGKCDGRCKSGFRFDLSTQRCIVSCDLNCISPCSQSGEGKCDSSCKSGFVLDSSSKTCKQCDRKCISGCQVQGPGECDGNCQPNYGPYRNGRSKNCARCSDNCATGCNVNGGGLCDKCVDGYGLTDASPRICQLCDINCAGVCTSNGAGKCDGQCRPGYVYESSSKTCRASPASVNPYPGCDSHCDGGCSVAGSGKCDGNCYINYGKTSSLYCGLCAENCAGGCRINGAGSCDSCSPGYGLTDRYPKICKVCDDNCADVCTISGAGRCDNLCSPNYVIRQTDKVCDYMYNKAGINKSNILMTGFLSGFLFVISYLLVNC